MSLLRSIRLINMAKYILPYKELQTKLGQEVAVSDWLEMTQERFQKFADATDDQQWIHVNPERAARESPFKSTIGHGFLSLSMLSRLLMEAVKVEGNFTLGLNYGLNKVRFTSPVPAGGKIRGHFSVQAIDEHEWGVQTTWAVTMELEGSEKPCMVAEWLVRSYF